jgi:hypothetical protein
MSTRSTSIAESALTRDLRTLFCERFGCSPSNYEQRALRKCLYPHAKIIAPLLHWIKPGCLERDLDFINYLGSAKNWQEVKAGFAALQYQDSTEPSFARNALRLRISGRKAAKLAAKLLPA